MKRFLSVILSLNLAFSILPEAYAAGSVITAYECFEYAENTALKECVDLQSGEKGFAGNWAGDAQLTAAVTDNFAVAGSGRIKSTASGSNAIYRGLKNNIDFSSDGFYTLSYDMKLNSGAVVSDNTKTQKLALTNIGATKNTEQLQLGFACGRNGSAAPYMRALSSISFYDDMQLETDKLYNAFVILDTSAGEADEITYILRSGETEAAEFKKSASIDKSFEVVLYQEFTGGSGNEFGNMYIEYYDAAAAAAVKNAEQLLSAAQESLSDSDAEAFLSAAKNVQGRMKTYFEEKAELLNKAVESDKALGDTIASEIASVRGEILSFDDEQEIREKLNILEQNTAKIVNKERKSEQISAVVELSGIFEAELAVRNAEKTKTVDDIEAARISVNELADSAEKETLSDRLDAVQKDMALKTAQEKTAEAEVLKTVSALESAKMWIELLEASAEKEELESRLDAVEEYINAYIPEIKSVSLSGTAAPGGVLTADCITEDLCGNLKETEISWYYSESESGAWSKLDKTGAALEIIYEYNGKYIKASASAVNTAGLKSEEKSAVVYISPTVRIAYEDFGYTVGKSLNEISEAAAADSTKGFLSGWHSDVNLQEAASDSFTVAADGMLEALPSNSGIYRGLSTAVNMDKEGIYILQWDMRPNSGFAANDATRTQKMLLLPKGVSSNQGQLQFGLVGGENGISPYIRALSGLSKDTAITVTPGELYRATAYIEASANEADKICYMVNKAEDDTKSEWDISYEADLSNSFDVIGYVAYTGGGAKNAIGNIVVEFYDEAQKAMVSELYEELSAAIAELSEEKLTEAEVRAARLPEGALKEQLQLRLAAALETIQQEKGKIQEISEELEALKNEAVTAANAAEIKERLALLKEKTGAVNTEADKAELAAEYEAAVKIIQMKLVAAERAVDKFDYASGSEAILPDAANGWSSGYTYADGTAAENLSFSGSSLIFTEETEIYRSLSCAAAADEEYDTFIRLKFMLSENGSISLKIGGLEFEFAETAAVSSGGAVYKGTKQLEKNKSCTAVIHIGEKVTRAAVFADGESYYGDDVIVADTDVGMTADTICLKGKNAAMDELVKENIGGSYAGGVYTSVAAMLTDMTEESIDKASDEAEKIASSVLKDAAETVISGVRYQRDNILPTIRTVGIAGTGRVGDVLTASVSVDDSAQNLKTINYIWYCGGQTVSTSAAFTPDSSHSGKRTYCSVTVTNTAGKTSEPTESNAITISNTTPSYGGGGGSSSGSGSFGSIGAGASMPEAIYFEEESGFSDIKGHWAEEIIKNMVSAGVAAGVSAKEFMPDAAVKRAEFAAFLERALKLSGDNKTEDFEDVNPGDWFYSSVLAVSDFISGWDGKFHPESDITREAMARIISLVCGERLDEYSQEQLPGFDDNAEMSSWSAEHIQRTCAAGIFAGNGDNRFLPKKSATRAEALAAIEKLLKVLNDEG